MGLYDVTPEELAVLLPQITAMWTVRVSGDRPMSPQRQSQISQRLAELWTRFLQENQTEWEAMGLTWDSFYLTTQVYHGGPVEPESLSR